MRFTCFVFVLASCVHSVCGALDPEAIIAFHHSHAASVTANESSVMGLAVGDDPPDGGNVGLGWQVCVEGGKAEIQNRRTLQEIDEGWSPTP